MGAWGHDSFDNDTAMGWVDDQIVPSLLQTVRSKLETFVDSSAEDDIENEEAEAAVALLVLFCSRDSPTTPSRPINLYWQAKEQGVFELATRTVAMLLNASTWLNEWSDPPQKRQVLEKLLQTLQALAGGS